MSQYIVLSLKHTSAETRRSLFGKEMTPAIAGSWSQRVFTPRQRFWTGWATNSGCANIAVPAEVVIELCEKVEYDTKEYGLCLPNKAGVWSRLLAAVITPTQYEPKPDYRGAR